MADLWDNLRKRGVRWRWVGTWPAIPDWLDPAEPTPRRVPQIVGVQVWSGKDWKAAPIEVQPDAPPQWVDRIHERFFEKVLWLKSSKPKSIDFVGAAIYGFVSAASSVPRVATLYEDLPPPEDEVQARRRKLRLQEAEEEDRRNRETTVANWERKLAEVKANGKPEQVADCLKGFDYGIKRQQDHESHPRSDFQVTAQIYKALVKNYVEVELLIYRKATAREIGEFVAARAIRTNELTHAEYFAKFPAEAIGDSVELPSGEVVSTLTREGRKRAERLCAEGQFLKLVEKICGYVGIPLPGRGRPSKKS